MRLVVCLLAAVVGLRKMHGMACPLYKLKGRVLSGALESHKMDKMQPDASKISIDDNLAKIKLFLREVILEPRRKMHKWSIITNQTPNLKIGYPGQHLASLILGMKGTGTGARGDDIVDGTEVKSCSRIDQLDKCKKCNGNVLRSQKNCPTCGSSEIKRNDDSKWLIAIRSESELEMYLRRIPRMLLIISDYPGFDYNDFSSMRIRAYEIWNQSSRAAGFRNILTHYFNNIFLEHIKKNPKATPAPYNFWPDSFAFYMCNPIKIFESTITDIDGDDPGISITHYIEPNRDRSSLASESMPSSLLVEEEKECLRAKGVDFCVDGTIDETMRGFLPIRLGKAVSHLRKYQRKTGRSTSPKRK